MRLLELGWMRGTWFAVMAILVAFTAAPPIAHAQGQPAPSSTTQADADFRKGGELYAKRNHAEAMRWYRKAADAGHVQAQVQVGNMYAEGEGVAQDYAQALRWFRMAAEKGNAEAENDVGMFHLMGMGVKQDPAEGARWLRKAAGHGNEVAERNLGMMYLQGMGVAQDRKQGIEWLRKAAAHGDDEAKSALKAIGAK